MLACIAKFTMRNLHGRHIVGLQVGDRLAVKGPFSKIAITRNMKKSMGFIAGGSGITPMLQIIEEVLSDPRDDTELRLLFANRSARDILLKARLDALQLKHPRFKVCRCRCCCCCYGGGHASRANHDNCVAPGILHHR